EKQRQIDEIILASLGVKAEFLSAKELSFPSEKSNASLLLNNPSATALRAISFDYLDETISIGQDIKDNVPLQRAVSIELAADFPVSQPYWIEKAPEDNLFVIDDQLVIGQPFNPPAVAGQLIWEIDGLTLVQKLPLKYKYNDPVDGEINQPFTVVPEIKLSIDQSNVFVINGEPQTVEVQVNFEDGILEGELLLDGLSNKEYELLEKRADEFRNSLNFKIRLQDIAPEGKQVIQVKYRTSDGRVFDRGMKRIAYKHIPNLTYFPEAS